nr:MAG TPA: hypothetical protein [Caudoviricetes sp.]
MRSCRLNPLDSRSMVQIHSSQLLLFEFKID